MRQANLVEFVSKQCKKEEHIRCCGLWEGLGFKVLCDCICHRNNPSKVEEEEVKV